MLGRRGTVMERAGFGGEEGVWHDGSEGLKQVKPCGCCVLQDLLD
jgi:hypothetical protein